MSPSESIKRCPWSFSSELILKYHDEEWGRPVHDDRKLFEVLLLDTFQAGLNWILILNKREHFREAFDNFQPQKIARYSEEKINQLLNDPSIIRNKLKISAAVNNAHKVLDIQNDYGSFDNYIWQFTNGKTISQGWTEEKKIPAKTIQSDAMSKALYQKGFKFVGSTTCYAFMQSIGMVNDHLISCYRFSGLAQ
ncbi:MAG: 3-methyladenine glycosylase [Mucilaginibacter sp.]|nr:3-methyladenine glycosylase [Mucilaginibacter sp.]